MYLLHEFFLDPRHYGAAPTASHKPSAPVPKMLRQTNKTQTK